MTREERRLAERLLRLTKESRIPWRRLNDGALVYVFSCFGYHFLLGWRSRGEGGSILTIRQNVNRADDIIIQGFLVEQLYQDINDLELAWLSRSGKQKKQKKDPDEKEKARREVLRGALRLLGEIAR